MCCEQSSRERTGSVEVTRKPPGLQPRAAQALAGRRTGLFPSAPRFQVAEGEAGAGEAAGTSPLRGWVGGSLDALRRGASRPQTTKALKGYILPEFLSLSYFHCHSSASLTALKHLQI